MCLGCASCKKGDPVNVQEPFLYLILFAVTLSLLIWFGIALHSTMDFNRLLVPKEGVVLQSSQTSWVTWYGTNVFVQVQWVEYTHDDTTFHAGIFHEGPYLADGDAVHFYILRGNPYQAVGDRVPEGQLLTLVLLLTAVTFFIAVMLVIWLFYACNLCASRARTTFQQQNARFTVPPNVGSAAYNS